VSDPLNVALVAGETSGDLLAGLLLDGMRERWSGFSAQLWHWRAANGTARL
jgi:lipid-A-disaccharide synthase